MAKYNPNNHYIVAGMKMHPVGGVDTSDKVTSNKKHDKPSFTEDYHRESRKDRSRAALYGAANAAGQFKYLRLEDIKAYAPNIARRLEYGGLREGQRNLEQMQQMFEKIPRSERLGVSLEEILEKVDSYLGDKHFSHKQAYINGGSGDAENIYLENARDNLVRGGKDMTRQDLRNLRYRHDIDNLAGAARNGLKATAQAVKMAVFYVGFFAIIENAIALKNGNISKEKAFKNVLQSVGKAALAAAVVGFAIFVAAALIPGVATALVMFAPAAEVVSNALLLKRLFDIVYDNRNTLGKFLNDSFYFGLGLLALPFYPILCLVADE